MGRFAGTPGLTGEHKQEGSKRTWDPGATVGWNHPGSTGGTLSIHASAFASLFPEEESLTEGCHSPAHHRIHPKHVAKGQHPERCPLLAKRNSVGQPRKSVPGKMNEL